MTAMTRVDAHYVTITPFGNRSLRGTNVQIKLHHSSAKLTGHWSRSPASRVPVFAPLTFRDMDICSNWLRNRLELSAAKPERRTRITIVLNASARDCTRPVALSTHWLGSSIASPLHRGSMLFIPLLVSLHPLQHNNSDSK